LAMVLLIGIGLGRKSVWLFFLNPIIYYLLVLLDHHSYFTSLTYILENKVFLFWLISSEAILIICAIGLFNENKFKSLESSITSKKKESIVSEEKFRSIFESLHDIYYQTDLQGKITMISPSIKARAGYEPKEVIGKCVTEFYVDPNVRKVFIARLTEKGVVHDYETDLVSKDVNVKHVEISSKIVYGNNNTPIAIEGTIHDVSSRKVNEKYLKERSEKIKLLSAHIQNSYEEEKTRFSREIHDELGQQLASMKMDALGMKKQISKVSPELVNRLSTLIASIDNSIEKMRRIGTELHPGILDDLGLLSTLEWQGQEFELRTGIKFSFTSDLKEFNPDIKLSINIFRIFQEALSNIERHSLASMVETRIKLEDNNLVFDIKDNGKGFDVELAKTKASFGLLGIYERISILNGYISVVSSENKGTEILLRIPIITS